MNFKSFTINYIKEPFLFPLKDIKKLFIGALILTICYLFQIFMMLTAYCIFQIYCATPQEIIDFLSILPFSILIYGYIGLIITDDNGDSLPKWSDLKSIIYSRG
ncbi:hypothetical protein [Methanothermococcus okinawensis]|uniref:Uncharacterized protein n=1 Tax=Methanothermococcus okinawensis (strain DSM 14208 / JCM 11175 / IH1) TaxID=647113 RepID=F8AKS9_METOI|nr:hypothetical protein [Methanothermococcus okinawensis]AEH06423.1 hypothetical protein Metok_0439 [Methanothermococcus okinawensis IH1]